MESTTEDKDGDKLLTILIIREIKIIAKHVPSSKIKKTEKLLRKLAGGL